MQAGGLEDEEGERLYKQKLENKNNSLEMLCGSLNCDERLKSCKEIQQPDGKQSHQTPPTANVNNFV
jgi:hypothetical protein